MLKSITQKSDGLFKDRGSKFLASLHPVRSEDEVDEALQSVKKEHPQATHHCFAWRIDPANIREFSQDDGEPSGTAGLPILNAMRSAGLINCLIIVVRYYGGTNLGKGGLIQAYGAAAEESIQNARLKSVQLTTHFRITYRYEQQNLIDKWKNLFEFTEKEADYGEQVTLLLGCSDDKAADFKKIIEANRHLLEDADETGKGFDFV
jgi:uncharacterized YigZ family protein